ncbi:hypothetical protein [Raineyella sp. LH-20]|uniref:hypothetical protein n=1 Tax=Raineyella sp. LH-20 TaxID=3081204 RepID=UPI002954FCD4|nr:hypothetical protein [Raineyella sp. LH-20]WOP17543.1 hypothetical protein R0146_09665 [Raineyella sp. LH-20]
MGDLPVPGQRIALRWHDDRGPRELIGYVHRMDPEGLTLLDRTLTPRLLGWPSLESWRGVPQVPRGRDPQAADRVLLDRMAIDRRLGADDPDPHPGADDPDPDGGDAADRGSGELCQVARLGDLLGGDVPTQRPEAYDTGDGTAACALGTAVGRAIVVGEWATVRLADGDRAEQVVTALARWAAYRDARNVQVRGCDRLLPGFTAYGLRSR